ncbi:hypothetical protein ACFOEZ_01125 [Tianweitania populi]|uniref:Uncharacterized protein n=1 Tax=Tianweitania populi TaxID=1607949 RepID=A0A8J3GIJ4_9HYPH|nr:hypothetical protein [Tianweitania populi]GHD05016.1 hypothetical protein GCM10016234_00380 [Tianweitania populi]
MSTAKAEMQNRAQDGSKAQTPVPAAQPDQIPARGVLATMFGLLAGIGVSALLVMGLLFYFAGNRTQPDVPPLVAAQPKPAGPQLEISALGERPALDARAAAELTRYRWLDVEHERAQVPISRAMEMVADQGWPDGEEGGR